MKNVLQVLSIALLIALPGSAGAQFTFSVSPGLTFSSASFGDKMGKIVPYIGFQHAGLSLTSSVNSRRFNNNTGQMENFTDETKMSGTLLIPYVGVKFFFVDQEKLKAYGNVLFSKPIVVGKYTVNGAPDSLFNNVLTGISLWGGEAGFGVEYFLDAQFSIGGEFGFRPIIVNSTTSDNIQVFNPNTMNMEPVTRTFTTKTTFSPTYAKLILNFYFNKKNKGSPAE